MEEITSDNLINSLFEEEEEEQKRNLDEQEDEVSEAEETEDQDDENILVGMVLFNPDIEKLRDSLTALVKQFREIVMVDNGSRNREAIEALVMGFLTEYPYVGISLHWNEKNLGVAKALNQIFSYAERSGIPWVLTMDQDSVIPENFRESYEKYMNQDSVAMICPVIYDNNRSKYLTSHKKFSDIIEEDSLEVEQCITSGSMLKTDAWKMVNGFDEKLFIDGVDFDLCAKLRKKGQKILLVQEVILQHNLGKVTKRRFFFKPFYYSNYSSKRMYYYIRNTLYLGKKHGGPIGYARAWVEVAKRWLLIVIYDKNRKKKVYAIKKGIQAAKSMK